MKKFFAILMSLALMLSLAVPAMAEGETTYSITIDNDVKDYVYTAYQIFTGDLSGEAENDDNADGTNAKLSNIKWGNGVEYKGTGVTVGTGENATTSMEAADIAAALAAQTLSLEDFLKDLTLKETAKKTSTYDAEEEEYVISGLNAGYYLVKNETVPTAGSYTEYIVEVVENSTVSPKGTVPSVEKKVDDENDSVAGTDGEDDIEWQDSADHDIGDVVNFKLTATLPNNYSAYERYKLTFEDTFEHFEQINITSVYLADAQGNAVANATFAENETTGYTKQIEANSFTVTFANLKTSSIAAQIKDSYKVVVEYTAVLSSTATLGAPGNLNDVKLIYSNNPNYEGSGENEPTGETPKDTVIVFTYKTVINKVKADGSALSGAEFTLEKFVKVLPSDKTPTEIVKKIEDGEETEEVLGYWIAVEQVETLPSTTFTFTGLDDGNYRLTETKTPEGYNSIDPIEFTVTANHKVEWDGNEATRFEVLESLSGNVTTGTITFTASNDKSSLSSNVVNKSGTVLPETGGMGTTIFYAVGGVMVAAAAILLVTKKRMSNNA